MTQAELEDLAREAQENAAALTNFGYLAALLVVAGALRLAAPETHRPNRTQSDGRTAAHPLY